MVLNSWELFIVSKSTRYILATLKPSCTSYCAVLLEGSSFGSCEWDQTQAQQRESFRGSVQGECDIWTFG